MQAQEALGALTAAFEQPEKVAERLRREGHRIAHVIGSDVPRELLIAAGLTPIRLPAATGRATPRADRLLGSIECSWRTHALLEGLLQLPASEPVVISHADAELPQLFAMLREFSALGEIKLGTVHLVDLKHLPRDTTRSYNRTRLRQLAEAIGMRSADALGLAIDASNAQREHLARIMKWRMVPEVRLSGSHALALIGSAAILPVQEHLSALRDLEGGLSELPLQQGRRAFVTGTRHEDARWYALLEECGLVVVGEDHDWGDPWFEARIDPLADPLDALADPSLRVHAVGRSLQQRGGMLERRLRECRPEFMIELCFPGDETAPWQSHQTRRVCAELGIRILTVDAAQMSDADRVRQIVLKFIATGQSADVPVESAQATPKVRGGRGARSRKSLRSLAALSEYQKEWFQSIRARAAAGEPIAVVNANAPQEILRALDIPFVVNQWWASIVAAKQQSSRYLGLLRDQHYPTTVDAYSSQGIAAALDSDAANAPWGGLPTPTFLQALNSSDATPKLFEAWAAETDADLFVFERTVEPRWRIVSDWWQQVPDRWDEVLEPERLDLLVAEMRELISQLERRTGRTFSAERFAEVMDLVNEQEDYYRLTRDLIARTIPAPVSVVDTMPATMTPQWQRGTVWARDAARAFYEEVRERAAAGEAACANEAVRLMWVGRGMWSDMGFYQQWEASHGAVFVWSMYLALAADGYIRRFDGGRDPLRALAARVVTMGDELRMPTWAAAWHVNEARTHSVDGAVALSDADPFVLRALELAGIPVLALPLDNFSKEDADRDAIERSVTAFIEGPAGAMAARRRTST